MCGIVGYLGTKAAAPILLTGLKRLEYRGYDSAGLAVLGEGRIGVCKRKGRVSALGEACDLKGTVGIGHTRWATHGAPSEANAHPHVYGKFAIVHNGIIENHVELRRECEKRGEIFSSETDSETVAHLLNFYYKGDFKAAFFATLHRLKGSFALAALCEDRSEILAARLKSPLIVGRGEDGLYLASDVPALSGACSSVFVLEDGECAELRNGQLKFYRREKEIEKKALSVRAGEDFPELAGFDHFMRKEISEIPAAIANSLVDFESDSSACGIYSVLCQTEHLHIVACGTAYHSAVAAKYAIERLARIPVETSVASEYRYREPIYGQKTLVIAISQSGETADTLAAAMLAKERGEPVLAITNAPESSLTRLADHVLVTGAGREIAVAATKSFNAQLAVLYSIAVALARSKGREASFSDLRLLPALSEEVVSGIGTLKEFAPEFAKAKSVYFIGRGADYCAAIEGSLKLKEISYLPSEGYPAGELKHGTLALIEEGTPVVAILTDKALAQKTMNAVAEVYARGGRVLLVTSLDEFSDRREVAHSVLIPRCNEVFSPILSVIPLQALAYFTALERGNDPDKPRNLAKSVTVE